MIAISAAAGSSSQLPSKRHPATQAHLLTCASCRDRAVIAALAHEVPAFSSSVLPGAGPATGGSRDDEVRRLVQLLERTPPKRLRGDLRRRAFFRREVLEQLLALGEAASRDDPQRAERLGLLAVVLASRLETDADWVPPGLASASLLVAGARRLGRNFKGAEEALRRAAPFLVAAAEEAVYARTAALLRWEEGRLCEAAALLVEAGERFAAAEMGGEEAVCLALQGLLATEEGRWERALAALLRVQPELDARRHPALALHARLAIAQLRAELGDPEAARALLEDARSEAATAGLAPAEAWIAVTWVEARVALRAGRYEEASQQLLPLRARLSSGGRLAETALVCLDLALIAVFEGDREATAGLADGLAETFAGRAELAFALQALYELDGAVPGPAAEARKAAARSARLLRASFRAAGLPDGTIPYP